MSSQAVVFSSPVCVGATAHLSAVAAAWHEARLFRKGTQALSPGQVVSCSKQRTQKSVNYVCNRANTRATMAVALTLAAGGRVKTSPGNRNAVPRESATMSSNYTRA